jgi:hypothetical protein
LNEVVVKPTDIPSMYEKMIKESNKKGLQDKNTLVSGTYFQSVLIIDLKTKDSAFMTKVCDLDIHKTHEGKKIKYKLIPASGRKFYSSNSSNKTLDTNMVQSWSNTIPKFTNTLDMDLSNAGKYEINFKNKEINNRNERSFTAVENKRKNSVIYKIGYQQNLLDSYEYTALNECNSDNNIALCFAKYSISTQFRNDKSAYYLANFYITGDIKVQVNGKKLVIKMHQGFIENTDKQVHETTEYKDLDDFFKSIPFDKQGDFKNLYLFGN